MIKKHGGAEFLDAVAETEVFREKVSHFSLNLRQIQLSAVFGTRKRTALHGEGFAWVPDLRSFLKLLEVGVSPYLGFIPSLSVFQCFGWYEALNGRLIGPKTWDLIVGIFLRFVLMAVAVQKIVGFL